MIVCHSMSYLSFSFCAFSSTGCFFWLRQCKAKFSTRCNCFSGALWRIEILSSCDGVTLRHGDCALIGEVQFLLQDYLTDSWIASRNRSQAGLSKISEKNTDRVSRAYTLGVKFWKKWFQLGCWRTPKSSHQLFCWGYHVRWFLDFFWGEVESKCSKIILEWANLFWLQHG